MFKSWFKPKNKFSLENLRYLHSQLEKNPVVTEGNKDHLVEVLRTIAELMIWGDQHNTNFFDFFAEKSLLSFFLKILIQKCDTKVKIQVIQTLSILIQNIQSETSVFYLLSNNYINELIVHRFDFSNEELLAYYISFLKTLSLKLNPRTIQFFFNELANDFPLYSEAIKFFNHPESMVRVAVRTLTLNVYGVDYPALRRFILDRSAVPYFYNLVWFLRSECQNLQKMMKESTHLTRSKLEEVMESLLDLLYYLQDIMNLGIDALSQTLSDQLLSHFILPELLGSLTDDGKGKKLEPRLALFLLSQVFMTFQHYPLVNSIAAALIDPKPPQIIDALVTSPPHYPVKAPLPLTFVLFPKCAPAPLSELVEALSAAALANSTQPPQPEQHITVNISSAPADSTQEKEHSISLEEASADPKHSEGAPTPAQVVVPPIATPLRHQHDSLDVSSPTHPNNTQSPRSMHSTDGMSPRSYALQTSGSHLYVLSMTPDPESKAARNKDLPPDENLRARSVVPDIGPVSSPMQEFPNWHKSSDHNSYRDVLIAYLGARDERLVFGATSVLLALLKNPKIDSDLLASVDVFPQHLRKSLKILNVLTSAQTESKDAKTPSTSSLSFTRPPFQGGFGALITREEEDENKSVAPANPESVYTFQNSGAEEDYTAGDLVSVSVRVSITEDGKDVAILTTIAPVERIVKSPTKPAPLFNENDDDSSIMVRTRQRSSSQDAGKQLSPLSHLRRSSDSTGADPLMSKAAAAYVSSIPSSSLDSHTKRVHTSVDTSSSSSNNASPSPKAEPPTKPRKHLFDSPAEFEYSRTLASAIIKTLQRPFALRIVSINLLAELLYEIAYTNIPGPCISPDDLAALDEAYEAAGKELFVRSSGPLSNPNLILDLFEEEWHLIKSQRPQVREMISNTMSLLPFATNATSNIPLEYRRPAGDIEISRQAIQSFLLLRDLRHQMRKSPDRDFPASLTISISKMKVNDLIELQLHQVIPCTVVSSQIRAKLFLVLHPRYFILAERHADKVGWGVIRMLVPARLQEPFLDRVNPPMINFTLRIPYQPFPGCVVIRGANSRPMWTLTLLFVDRNQCMAARNHLQQCREAARKVLLNQILAILPKAMPSDLPPLPDLATQEDTKDPKHAKRTSISHSEEPHASPSLSSQDSESITDPPVAPLSSLEKASKDDVVS